MKGRPGVPPIHPYTHEMYLRSKESRKRADDKWLSNPENKKKKLRLIADWAKKHYDSQKQMERIQRSKDRRYLKSVNGDLVKFAEYIENKHRKPNSIHDYFTKLDPLPKLRKHKKKQAYVPHSQSFKQARRNAMEKANLFAFYGGRCAMCGEDDTMILQMHHIKGDGAKHRADVGHSRAMKREMYYHPNWNRYQLLCFKCHLKVHLFFYGSFTRTHPSE